MVLLEEIITIAISIGIFLAYEWRLRKLGAASPMRVTRSAHATIRTQWVATILSRPGLEILVIQTLRNSIMAASFMASTAILALIGALNLSGLSNSSNSSNSLWHAGTSIAQIMQEIKLLLLIGTFFASFMYSSMSVRFFNHTGYIITSRVASGEEAQRQSLATAYLNRAGYHYSQGLRTFFACIPLLAAIFNTYLMVPATLLLVWSLYQFDQLPEK